MDLGKDLSYLLRYDIYHSLSQIDIPPALRSEFVSLTPDEPLSTSLNTLEKLLAEAHFLLAAYLSGIILTSSLISPTDVKVICALFYTRLACLELSGNAILAAQESKALEDLSSTFYYVPSSLETADAGSSGGKRDSHVHHPRHIVPWPLRVLAVRLQSIGFGDSRRGIAGLYELGLEARREIMRPGIGQEERKIWKERLADLGIRAVNALIEMGDLDAAKRSLNSLRSDADEMHKMRKALLLLVIGDLDAANQVFGESSDSSRAMFTPLLSMAEGRYNDAAGEWRALLEGETKRTDEALVTQNLAVCLLYTGELNEVCRVTTGRYMTQLTLFQARVLLESLVSANHSFSSLLFNLSTVYELCSDHSGKLKWQLVDTVAQQPVTGDTNLNRPNADFKL